MIKTPRITILMATYNGAHYLAEQLDSLLAQTYTNWQLIIRDDGSTDKTIDIIKEFADRYPHISLAEKNWPEKGACANFAALFDIAYHDPEIAYIMFCDQDDIWKPEKLQKTMDAMQVIEKSDPGQPTLIYSNFELMDANGAYMPGEFKLKHSIHLRHLLSFNFVYGCTTMLNRALINRIAAIPAIAINHDYWIALVASIYKSGFINEPLLRYRQHGHNASGNVAGNNSLTSRLKRNFTAPEKELNNLRTRLRMLEKFYQLYQKEMSAPDRKILTTFLHAFQSGRFKVATVMLSNGIFRNGLLQTLASFFQVIFFFDKLSYRGGGE
ncbi:glycosyltransferase family 2 protein [Mucilaginibacter lutimaris]|uniref:Glycosyltransferase family 2 protein n=1 Tax=Mucilaginibacter lutimaris TaxID=931629 RepID=A0ABW2ZEU0_9SPHI